MNNLIWQFQPFNNFKLFGIIEKFIKKYQSSKNIWFLYLLNQNKIESFTYFQKTL